MKKSPDHQRLMKVLNRLVKQERWAKIPKKKGEVIEKTFTGNKNLKLVLKTKKDKLPVYVLKRNKNLYEEALKAEEGDWVSVALRTYLGRYYCVRFIRKKKEKKLGEWL